MNKIAIPTGLLLGAFSWGVVSLVSDGFEPFDSEAGFYIGQAILSVGAIYFGYKNGLKSVLFYLIGAHIGMNVYAYIFGYSDTRIWFQLGLLTTLVLLFYPLISGVIGKLIQYAQKTYNKSLKQTD